MTVLGLDGGGTKTVVALADRSGRVVNVVQGVGLDPTAGPDWEARLMALLAGLGPVQAAVLGLPYYSEIPAISARQTALAQAALGPAAEVMNDVAVAYEGALGGAEGVLVLAGTGSMAWARGPLGVVRVGGWGELFGDEGSAWWIGREALTRISRHLDGRQAAPGLTAAVLAGLGIGPDGLIEWAYGQPRAAIAGLARQVAALAETDADAAEVMARAAGQLVDLAQTAARRSGLGRHPDWSFAGGVFGSAVLRTHVTAGLGRPPVVPRLPPVGGAVLAAARKAGWPVDARFIDTLADGLGRNLNL